MTLDEGKIAGAVRALAEARATGRLIDRLPDEIAPADEREAWAIHEAAVSALGPVAGWKVGAPAPDARASFGEISADTIHASPARFEATAFTLWAVEAEIAVTFAADLPARDAPYAVTEVIEAVAGWRPAIEVLDTAFSDWAAAPSLHKMADRQNHGALVLGDERAMPRRSLATLPVRLTVDGRTAFSHEGGNSGGDPVRLLVELANARRGSARPIRSGDVVTTGSTTPFLRVGPGQTVGVTFDGLGSVELSIAPAR